METKDLRFMAIIALGIIALILLGFFFVVTKTETFQIADKCGRVINLFQHTIDDESTCKIRCEQQCEAKDVRYSSYEFKLIENSCNECFCTCREMRWS